MAKRMLIDAAHPEETRVVVLNGSRLEEFDFETSTKKQIKGNIYLAKVTRVEPSLQAAFVEYGGNRHGFLAFSEIHPDYYRIPVADRQAALAAERAAEQAANDREEARERDEDALPSFFDTPVREERRAHDAHADEIHSDEEPDDEPSEPDERHEDYEPEAQRAAEPYGEPESHGHHEEHEAYERPDTPAAPETLSDPWSPAAPPSEAVETLPESPLEGGGEPSSYAPPAEMAAPGPGDRETPDPAAPAHDNSAMVGEETMPPTVEPHSDIVETVGGDELEETTRPRARPFRHYKIQEVIKRRQIMLVQVAKEERGNKGAALTTYLSLAGRYCVLMPNTPRGGGVSRKITNNIDRRRLKELMSDLNVPEGMGVIVRTAGSERSRTEIKRDFEYLLRLWEEIRDLTFKSTAPALIYEEGNLIKRSIRDLYARDIEEVLVDGDEGYRTAKDFMKMLMPSHAKRVKPYRDPSVPLLMRFQVEGQIDAIHSPVVQLRSGGYIVINPTEALVAIDVNSGRSTRERNIEETALKTNVEAAEEVARQLRLRDLAGLIVIDFIDMEEHRNRGSVERRLKEAMRFDRARIQLGRISPFGLLELSRQRLRPSLVEASTAPCPHCNGTGHIRSIESTALHVLRAIEEEGMRRRSAEIAVAVPTKVALYVLNHKRDALQQTERRFGLHVTISNDDELVPPAFRLERLRALTPDEIAGLPIMVPEPAPEEDEDDVVLDEQEEFVAPAAAEEAPAPHEAREPREPRESLPAPRPERGDSEGAGRRRRRRGRGRHGEEGRGRHGEEGRDRQPRHDRASAQAAPAVPSAHEHEYEHEHEAEGDAASPQQPQSAPPAYDHIPASDQASEAERKRRRRGRRGGRRRRRDGNGQGERNAPMAGAPEAETVELLPPGEPAYEDAQVAVAEAFAATPAPEPSLETASVPVTDHAEERAVFVEHRPEPAAPVDAEPEHAPRQYDVPPAHEDTSPPANPRRGWWRR